VLRGCLYDTAGTTIVRWVDDSASPFATGITSGVGFGTTGSQGAVDTLLLNPAQ